MEIKFYEMIGIRKWKRFVMFLNDHITGGHNNKTKSNYHLKDKTLSSVKEFRSMLLFNAIVHIIGEVFSILSIIAGTLKFGFISLYTLVAIIVFLLNLYCVLLQRYNWLRIRKVIEKCTRK